MNDDERALYKFPETFKSELAAIAAGAKNGGIISPRRTGGLLTELEWVKNRYAAKIALVRVGGNRAPSMRWKERSKTPLWNLPLIFLLETRRERQPWRYEMDMTTLKGRNTIRKDGSVTGATGQASKQFPVGALTPNQTRRSHG